MFAVVRGCRGRSWSGARPTTRSPCVHRLERLRGGGARTAGDVGDVLQVDRAGVGYGRTTGGLGAAPGGSGKVVERCRGFRALTAVAVRVYTAGEPKAGGPWAQRRRFSCCMGMVAVRAFAQRTEAQRDRGPCEHLSAWRSIPLDAKNQRRANHGPPAFGSPLTPFNVRMTLL